MKGMAVPAGAAEAARRLSVPARHAAAPPTEREEGDANALEPTIYRFILRYNLMSLLIAAE